MPKTSNPRFNGGMIANPLYINLNDPSLVGGNSLDIQGINTTTTRILNTSYGAINQFGCRRANGTGLVPTALANNDVIGQVICFGFGTAFTGGRAQLNFIASEAWNATNNGCEVAISVVANTTTTVTEKFRVKNDGSITIRSNAQTIYTANGDLVVRSYTVATLPAAGTAGRRAQVTDALGPVFTNAIVGGGAVVSPVYDTGAAWNAG